LKTLTDTGTKKGGAYNIHHIDPLFTIKGKIKINPKKDLIPVCPNCHSMIHLKKISILTIEELRNLILSK
jgi:5-methylcytosine-specific restriction protein A